MATGNGNGHSNATNGTGRVQALQDAITRIEREFGKGSIMKLGEATADRIESISTGSLALDLALGIGGIPRGRVIEIYGPESAGKSTLAQHILAEAQRAGGTVAYIDVEHALDSSYAARCGVNIDEMYISQPDTGEQALEITEALMRSGAMDAVIVDSVAALVPRAELEGDMGDPQMGLQARLMSQALRKLTGAISKTNTSVVFINQLREKVGVVFGNPEVTPGGRALKFYSSVRIELRRTETLKQGNQIVGNRVKARVVKNKVAPPFRTAEFDILFNHGISKEGDIIDLGVEMGIVKKSGAFFSYGEDRIGQGRENVREFLVTHPEISLEIETAIRNQSEVPTGRPPVPVAAAMEEEEE